MNIRLAQLVQQWEVVKDIHPATPTIFFQLSEHQAAGYVLWTYGGCPEAAVLMVGRLMESCQADRYPFWFNIHTILLEASTNE